MPHEQREVAASKEKLSKCEIEFLKLETAVERMESNFHNHCASILGYLWLKKALSRVNPRWSDLLESLRKELFVVDQRITWLLLQIDDIECFDDDGLRSARRQLVLRVQTLEKRFESCQRHFGPFSRAVTRRFSTVQAPEESEEEAPFPAPDAPSAPPEAAAEEEPIEESESEEDFEETASLSPKEPSTLLSSSPFKETPTLTSRQPLVTDSKEAPTLQSKQSSAVSLKETPQMHSNQPSTVTQRRPAHQKSALSEDISSIEFPRERRRHARSGVAKHRRARPETPPETQIVVESPTDSPAENDEEIPEPPSRYWCPQYKVEEMGSGYLVRCFLPNVRPENMEIFVDSRRNRVVVKGFRARLPLDMYPCGPFYLEVPVPFEGLDVDAVSSQLRNHILEISLPRRVVRQRPTVAPGFFDLFAPHNPFAFQSFLF